MKRNLIYLYGNQGGNIMRISNKLSPLIDISKSNNIDAIIDTVYDEFKCKFMNKLNRPRLFGKFVYIKFSNWIDYKAEIFWHFISLNELERFGIFPCENNTSENVCMSNCLSKNKQVVLNNGQTRDICIYRAIRISWIWDIINLANDDSKNIKYWIKDKKMHIRFQDDDVDYIIILEVKKNMYQIISAFPVFYINKKKTFDTDYKNYQKKPVITLR